MESLWNDQDAQQYKSLRALRVYSSRLLGSDPNLVLHGGGNTSVKETVTDLFGDEQQILTVKGSGWDLATIEEAGFAPVGMESLLKMAELDELSDPDMVNAQRAAMLDPSAPNPSVEAILHAIIPFTFVDHSHADAIVTITNTPDGEARIRQALGDKVLVVPYVMPGFILAKTIHEMTRGVDWQALEGIVLMNHGLFSFHDDAKTSYEKHIELVTRAEQYLIDQHAVVEVVPTPSETDLLALAKIRKAVSRHKGQAVFARLNHSDLALKFSTLEFEKIPNPGPLTPEHVIRTKAFGVQLSATDELEDGYDTQICRYVQQYKDYFEQHSDGEICLNPAPNYAIWKGQGSIAFGKSQKETAIIEDLNQHTFEAILKAEAMGGYQALGNQDLFDIEYWELEQAKLKKSGAAPALCGKTILIADVDNLFRQACVDQLRQLGAEVFVFNNTGAEMNGDRTGSDKTGYRETIIMEAVRRCGGLDALVLNMELEESPLLLEASDLFLQQGIDPAVLFLNSDDRCSPVSAGIRSNYIQGYQQANTDIVAELATDLLCDTAVDGARISF
ncbi:class II aldolase/adducin family protein [Motiliproteus sp. MSK22-1]|uniref:class II aldolase/adducin family protein n=1 Tax=Motiliproteus sp. MSK22-1 TaxID=1897630 RepID=UPI0009765FB7|nr:class II aldolase/adducin family protein [Motiliproteus sp. MSK22-1]OMH27990.1 hypothetical protein BGP75_21675 [Motiliproteus sp. MSK22-1]